MTNKTPQQQVITLAIRNVGLAKSKAKQRSWGTKGQQNQESLKASPTLKISPRSKTSGHIFILFDRSVRVFAASSTVAHRIYASVNNLEKLAAASNGMTGGRK